MNPAISSIKIRSNIQELSFSFRYKIWVQKYNTNGRKANIAKNWIDKSYRLGVIFPFWSKKKPKAITKERIIVGTQARSTASGRILKPILRFWILFGVRLSKVFSTKESAKI